MSYKTILVHADLAPEAGPRIRVAARLARLFDAHLTGCALTGISRFIPPDVTVVEGTPLAAFCSARRLESQAAMDRFGEIARGEDVASVETRMIDDDAGGMAVHARYADLVVLSQPAGDMPTPGTPDDLPGYLLREGGRPVLLVPRHGRPAELHGQVLFAWDGSMHAIRAVMHALPLLRIASSVCVLHISDADSSQGTRSIYASDMTRYLRRHGIQAHTGLHYAQRDTGAALLSAAAETGAHMIVMGAYSHSPLREHLFGGATGVVMRSTTLPVLFAH